MTLIINVEPAEIRLQIMSGSKFNLRFISCNTVFNEGGITVDLNQWLIIMLPQAFAVHRTCMKQSLS